MEKMAICHGLQAQAKDESGSDVTHQLKGSETLNSKREVHKP